ncbi:MAG: patatin-like phospholipase family protein, partial [Spirochaetaceae bacterium]|nr:patatin-like phospholipase family protein [Spirochaetaceae bacterium]
MARKKSGRVLGLALGGGGARGMAHIGILKALEEADIHFDVVTGTSVGSLVGALTAAGRSTAE